MTTKATSPNEISERQNSAAMIKLLRARRRIYARVKAVQRAYFVVALVLPVASLTTAAYAPEHLPKLSLFALVTGAFDAMLLDPWRKRQVKLAGKVQEEFDCKVLDLDWNKFIAGSHVVPEDVEGYGGAPLNPEGEQSLRNWYPADARELPLHLARLVCQRANLWYDSRLRRTYRAALWLLTATYLAALVVYGHGMTLSAFILTVLVPFGPFFTWVVREQHRQGDTITLVDRLFAEIEASLSQFAHAKSEEAARGRARELQDAIFAHRANSPLVSDLVYRFKRSSLEGQMKVAARDFIERLTRSAGAPL